MWQWTLLMLGILLSVTLESNDAMAGPIDPMRHPHPENAKLVHEAEHAVDHAWEVYHHAALGGTIASPVLQADIEEHLHEARTLVTQAQEAAERGDSAR